MTVESGRRKSRTRITCVIWRAALLPLLALSAIAGSAPLAEAQGASHEEGHAEDRTQCTSGKPAIAIVACTHIIEGRSAGDESRASALRNRAFYYQQLGDLDRAIADYTTVLKRPEQRRV